MPFKSANVGSAIHPQNRILVGGCSFFFSYFVKIPFKSRNSENPHPPPKWHRSMGMFVLVGNFFFCFFWKSALNLGFWSPTNVWFWGSVTHPKNRRYRSQNVFEKVPTIVNFFEKVHTSKFQIVKIINTFEDYFSVKNFKARYQSQNQTKDFPLLISEWLLIYYRFLIFPSIGTCVLILVLNTVIPPLASYFDVSVVLRWKA